MTTTLTADALTRYAELTDQYARECEEHGDVSDATRHRREDAAERVADEVLELAGVQAALAADIRAALATGPRLGHDLAVELLERTLDALGGAR